MKSETQLEKDILLKLMHTHEQIEEFSKRSRQIVENLTKTWAEVNAQRSRIAQYYY